MKKKTKKLSSVQKKKKSAKKVSVLDDIDKILGLDSHSLSIIRDIEVKDRLTEKRRGDATFYGFESNN